MTTFTPHLLKLFRKQLSGQRGAIDLAGALIGTGAASVLGVALAAGGPGLISAAQNEAAKQDLVSIHTTQSISHAQTGRFVDTDELLANHGIDAAARGIHVRVEHEGYTATATSKSGDVFTINSGSTIPLRVSE